MKNIEIQIAHIIHQGSYFYLNKLVCNRLYIASVCTGVSNQIGERERERAREREREREGEEGMKVNE